jgi:hypothetical protein
LFAKACGIRAGNLLLLLIFEMTELLERISTCVEFGKVDIKSPYPPAMKDQEGL